MSLQKTPLTSSPATTPAPAAVAAKIPVGKKPIIKTTSMPFWVGLGVSLAWVGLVVAVVSGMGGLHSLGGVALVDWAIGISAAISPVAMVWMITAYLQRASDIQSIAEPLRRQLTLITGESGAADARIRRFNQAIREQIDLLRSAQTLSQDDMEAIMERVNQHRADLERFESVSTQQVKEIQDVVRRSMFQMEQMMDDKFTMLRVLDGKLQQNGDGVARQVESVSEHVTKMLEEIETTGSRIAETLDRAQRDTQRLADTSRLQESSLTNAAEAASETLGGLSSKIDLSVTRFLERASAAREEAERLASALDAQTRALDEFSTTLPTRVSEAESVLRGVADRLYASEQMAREQAVNLSEKLAQQLDGLQSFMDRFTGRLSELDQGLDRRQGDLATMAERVSSTTNGFLTSWEKSITDLNDRTGNSLLRFTVVNDETRRNAETIAAHLNETTGKYEEVVTRLRSLSSNSSDNMKAMTEEIASHLSQFEALSAASMKAGEEVQARASGALDNLQQVLERVLAAREATQAVGQTLVKDINDAVTQNEKMIQRLNETSQLGVRALGAATETLSRQQNELVGKARASEGSLLESVQKIQQQSETAAKSLRDQSSTLMNLLAETQSHLIATDQKLQSFATQAVAPVQKAIDKMDATADHGLKTLGSFGEGVAQQVNRLQEFHTRIGTMSTQMGKTTAETAGTIESLSQRFAAVRATQEEAARQTLEQFTAFADRLQHEVDGFDDNTCKIIEVLQQATKTVGDESRNVLEQAKASGEHIKEVSASLRADADQIQSALHTQTEAIDGDLSRAEQKFAALGENIRQKADDAYALLDRTAAHYEDVSTKLDQNVGVAQGKVENLHAAIARQAEQIANDATKITKNADDIVHSTSRAVENLSTLKDKIVETNGAALEHSDKTINKLDEVTTLFEDRTATLVTAAESATLAVTRSTEAFADQTVKVVDNGEQVSKVLANLNEATSALAEKAGAIRVGMEQQNTRLLSQLSDCVSQLDMTGNDLRQIVVAATQGAEQASAKFADMTQKAGQSIGTATHDLHDMAERTDKALSALGVNVTQQAASLAVLGDQIGEQQKLLASAGENHRVQMLDMFDKITAAHAQASEVAERTITYLATSLKDIDKQIGEIGDRSQSTIGNVKIASMGFSDQSALLLQNAQAAEQQVRSVLDVTAKLEEQARQLRAGLQAEAERATESLGALLSRITTGGSQVRDLSANTSMAFGSLQEALGKQTSDLNALMNQISERQETLMTALDSQRTAIGDLLTRLNTAQDQTASIAERTATRLSEGASQITQSVEVIDARAQEALNTVQKASAGFASETEAIEKKARQVEVDARSLLATASGLHQEFSGLRTAMKDEGETAAAALSTLVNTVKSGTSELREASSSTEASLTKLNGSVVEQTAALSSAMQHISERQMSLASALDAQRDTLNGLLNRLVLAQDETASSAERSATRVTENAQRIEQHIDSMDACTQKTLLSMESATAAFAKEAEAIHSEAKHAEQQAQAILASSSDLHRQIYDMRTSMQNDGAHATEALDMLLMRITSGSGEVTTVSKDAEQSLSALNTTIEQITERQDNLSKALDGQREAITALLARFGQAQEEAASLAERTASRLNNEALSITNSIDTIGAQASATLTNVQTTVSSFTAQADAIKQQSAAAEEHVRGMMSVTSGMQEQAQKLRESMQVETGKVVEMLSGVVDKLDMASKQLRTETGETNKVFDQTALRFSTATQVGSDLLRSQTETLTKAAERSEASLASVSDKLRNHIKLAADAGEKAQAQAQTLADAAEFATNRMVTLRETIDSTDKNGREAMVAAAGRIDEAKAAMQGQIDQMTSATTTLAEQSEALRANLAASESALNEAAAFVREEAKQLPATLTRGLASVEAAAKALKSQTSEADQALVGTADRFITVTASARESILQEMKHVSAVADDASKILNGFNQLLAEQVASMQQSTSLLSGEQKDLVEKASTGVGALTEASQRLLTLRTEASATAERLVREFDALDQRAATTGGRLAQAGDGIVKQVQAIAAATTDAENRISGASDTLREQVDGIRGALQGQIDEISRGLLNITAQLERTGTNLRSTAVGAVADVERVGQRFTQTGAAATAQVDAGTERMRKATSEVASILDSFGEKFDQMIDHMAKAGADVKNQEGGTLEHLQRMLTHLGVIAQKMNEAREMSGDVSQQAIQRLDQVVTAVQSQMNKMTTSAQTAAGIMRGINQIYNDQTGALTKGVGDAHSQVLSMNKSIDEMQQRADRMRTALKTQGDELMTSLRQILAQLEMTGDGLTEAVNNTLAQQASAALKKIG